MDLDAIKRKLQEFFTDGLLTIVGCGLSSAEGMPGMYALAEHLREEIPKRVTGCLIDEWQTINALLEGGVDIESAMLRQPPSNELENIIQYLVGELMIKAEGVIAAEVISGGRKLRFSRLLKHIIKPNSGLPVVTTNYDRLIEIAAEMVGLGVDTMFVGQHIGTLNEKESKFSFCRDAKLKGPLVRLRYAQHLVLMKPHGSLDWYLHGDNPVRCQIPLSLPKMIITPGLNKYRNGYDRPFDVHREKANANIDRASRYLFIGYGFNDSHLETHLYAKLREGKPALIVTYELSENAQKILSECENVIAVSALPGSSISGSVVSISGHHYIFEDVNLWDIGIFIEEILEP